MGLFPSLDYKGLYNSIIPLIEVAPLIPYGLKGNYKFFVSEDYIFYRNYLFFQTSDKQFFSVLDAFYHF